MARLSHALLTPAGVGANLKASPLPPAPFSTGKLLTGQLVNWHHTIKLLFCFHFGRRKVTYFRFLFVPKTDILESLRLHFGHLGHHFGDPGFQWVTQLPLGGPGVLFYGF